jgi:hypothetical protein
MQRCDPGLMRRLTRLMRQPCRHPPLRCRPLESDDVVDPGDAAVQALLALTAENTSDPEKRDRLIDAILTLPPLTEWPTESREKLSATCQFIKDLAEDFRQRDQSGYGSAE